MTNSSKLAWDLPGLSTGSSTSWANGDGWSLCVEEVTSYFIPYFIGLEGIIHSFIHSFSEHRLRLTIGTGHTGHSPCLQSARIGILARTHLSFKKAPPEHLLGARHSGAVTAKISDVVSDLKMLTSTWGEDGR